MTTGVNVTILALRYTGLPTDTTLPVSSPPWAVFPSLPAPSLLIVFPSLPPLFSHGRLSCLWLTNLAGFPSIPSWNALSMRKNVNSLSDSSLSEAGGVAPHCEDKLPSPPSHSLKKGFMVPDLEDTHDSLPWSGYLSLPQKDPCQEGQDLLEKSKHKQMWYDLLPQAGIIRSQLRFWPHRGWMWWGEGLAQHQYNRI